MALDLFSNVLQRVTLFKLNIAARIASVCDIAAIDTDKACLCRNRALLSTSLPTDDVLLFDTDCQPRVGVRIFVMLLAAAKIAPAFSVVAVTVISPLGGSVIEVGNNHLLLLLSPTTPLFTAVPAIPGSVALPVENVAYAR